jgi:cytochrome c-type biogenesis protein CcmH/NrfG
MPLPPLAGEINTQPAQQAPVTQTETPVASIKQQLEELKEMQDQGLITEADFEAKKKQLLGI